MKTSPYEGDVLETSLNFGIEKAAEQYEMTKYQVYDIVRKFKDEIEEPCPCEHARSRGIAMLCFVCTKHSRINI